MNSPTRISPQEASDRLAEGGWTYVDVRTTEEFQAGHPPGAVNVPIAHATGPNPDFVRVMVAAFPRDAGVIVGCKAGGRSARAAQVLLAEGFANVLDQRAGWDGVRGASGELKEPGWSRAGLPSEEGQPGGRSWEDMKKKAE